MLTFLIRLPGRSEASDRALAPRMAELAVSHLQGSLAPATPPPGTENPCEQNNCTYLGEVEENGQLWLIYKCNGSIEAYPA